MANQRDERDLANAPTSVLVLLSGGVDSSCCVTFYLAQRLTVECLFVDYCHAAANAERRAARAIAKHYGVVLHEMTITGLPPRSSGLIPARNALLICTALASVAPTTGLVAIGIHGGTPYPDCTPQFVSACQSLTDIYTDGRVKIAAPFAEWTKGDLYTYAGEVGVPVVQTYSCEAGASEPCGDCLSCKDRDRAGW